MSGASTMRNAIKRITHKERAQPSWRKKLGLLEKHKDYVERAKDYHKKQNYVKKLRLKAENRNNDEFYFKMNNSEVRKGVHHDVKNGSLDVATVKLLKTQDMGYLVHKKSIDDRKIEKLKNNLHMIGDQEPKSHKVFLETENELESFDIAKHFDTATELVSRHFNRPRMARLSENSVIENDKIYKEILKKRPKAYDELSKRINRGEKIKNVVNKLQVQRNVMGKGTKRKIKDAEENKPAIYKWKRERLR